MQLTLPKDRNTLLAITVAALFLGGVIFGYTTIIFMPLHKDIVKSRTEVQNLSGRLNMVRQKVAKLPKLQQEMAELQIEVFEMEQQLPKSAELPGLLRTLTHRAETNGLQLSSLAPGKPVSKGQYDEIPYVITAVASFHSLGRFLTAMGTGSRLFATRNLTLSAAQAKEDSSKTVSATFSLITFQYHG
jgi:type IV pilus assembly protein PilO